MCDYSLHSVRTRPAKVGEKLVTHNFGTGTRGFAAPEDCSVAVCVLPGTELAFVREQSATVTVPGTRRASGSCPAGCMAKVGLWSWRQTTPHQRNGGSRTDQKDDALPRAIVG